MLSVSPTSARLRAVALLVVTSTALAGCGGGRGGPGEEPRADHLGFVNGTAPETGGIGGFQALALFGLAPLSLLLVVAALVWLPGMVRGTRYRPAKGWSASPLWFGGPPDPAAAVEGAHVGEIVRGGASGSW